MTASGGTKRKSRRSKVVSAFTRPNRTLLEATAEGIITREKAEEFIDDAQQPGRTREYLIRLIIEQKIGKHQSNLDFVKAWIPDTLRGLDSPRSTDALVKLAPKNIGWKRIEAGCAALVVDDLLFTTDEDRWALTEWLGRKTYNCLKCASFWHHPHPPKHGEGCPESHVQVVSTLKKKGR